MTKIAVCVNPGKVGISNTMNRADLTGIAFALKAKCTHIATDSAYSLSQIRKQLLFPELHRKHAHVKLLERIVSMINKSDAPINFYKVKAHIGVIGNESANAIAKHAALHNDGHDEAFPPPSPSPDSNPFFQIYWQKRTIRLPTLSLQIPTSYLSIGEGWHFRPMCLLFLN